MQHLAVDFGAREKPVDLGRVMPHRNGLFAEPFDKIPEVATTGHILCQRGARQGQNGKEKG
ncbi:hypothetical protein GCM10011326_20050 [Salipiger profundus]|nr:hypothetical protein GCM10011326_20050 [Salipiger profundus]